MVEPLRHRQTKEAATDMSGLQPPRHISTLPDSAVMPRHRKRQLIARRVGEEVAPSPPTDPDERVSRIRFLTREIR